MPGVTPSSHGEQGVGAPVRVARELWARGVVQGVGFRPFVYNLALESGVDGWVRNTSAGVQIVVEGSPAAVERFVAALPQQAPPRSYIASLEVSELACAGERGFRIVESAADPEAYQLVSPDIALCEDCRRELLDPNDRRYGYPFTNCTNCGPRFTIIESLPYDRERTTMRHFPLCPDCRREYRDPADRRFHAEPNACPVCGPRALLVGGRGLAGEVAAADTAACTGAAVEAAASVSAPPGAAAAGLAAATVADVSARGEEPAASAQVERAAGALADRLVVLSRSDAEHPDRAVLAAAALLRAGRIVAVKGLGGFHIACDATDPAAVAELKRRKGRPHKPLAVMFTDLDQVRAHCAVGSEEADLLASPEHPIVLLEWRSVGPSGEPLDEVGRGSPTQSPVAPGVAVRQRYLGAMLPYTPLHLLLMRAAGRPLVMTSGNLAEEPIVTSWREAGRLAAVPDAYLLHDRGIRARYDDSVALVRRGVPRLVRRSRGYAPFPVRLPRELPQVLACGAELKNPFCMTRDHNAFISQHIGDLENLETLEHFEASVELYSELFRLEPRVIAFDLHPEYLATKYAQERLQAAGRTSAADVVVREGQAPDGHPEGLAGFGVRLTGFRVQHHHAHVVACMAENGHLERAGDGGFTQVIGVSLDGLGYGEDGRLWGGEFLICSALGYRRAAHLEYLPLPGGALAIRRPARTAAGWLTAVLGAEAVEAARRHGLDLCEREATAVAEQVRTGLNAPLTSSCGRLFDCVAALCGLRAAITYEGQAAIELEMVSAAGAEPYPYEIHGDPGPAARARRLGVPGAALAPHAGRVSTADPSPEAVPALDAGCVPGTAIAPEGALVPEGTLAPGPVPAVVRLRPLLEAVLADVVAGARPSLVGSRLHATLAALTVDLCRRLRDATGIEVAALSGGVFQNRLLTDLCQEALEAAGFRVLTHALVPANDGGLSLGQAVVAGYNLLTDGGRRPLPAAHIPGS